MFVILLYNRANQQFFLKFQGAFMEYEKGDKF